MTHLTDLTHPPHLTDRAHATHVAIALGSDLGDRRAHLDFAAATLQRVLADLRVSSYFETAAVGMRAGAPDFLNAAAVGISTLTARDLLAALLDIEAAAGRERPYAGAPRTLDLDLILYGDSIIEEPGLAVPHPRFREREFVLRPLAEIAPILVDPVSGRTVSELLDQLSR